MSVHGRGRAGAVLLPVLALAALILAALPGEAASPSGARGRRILDFDADWRFLKADAPGAEAPGFDDRAWRQVDVPHDWSIEGPFAETNQTGGAGGFLPAGAGWYRKHFALAAEDQGRRAFLQFDGVMANSDVWINGHHLGRRPYGYVSFGYDLAPHLNPAGALNVIAVRADNSAQPASRWYAGAGIYRHVRLIITAPVHLAPWGTFVTTPVAGSELAVVRLQSTVTNQSPAARRVSLQIELLDPQGRSLGRVETKRQNIAAGRSAGFTAEFKVKKPRRWDLDQPQLHQAVTRVRYGREILDEETTPFGIRDFAFKPDTGFWLNGKNLKLKGVCLHHDGSALGAAVPLSVWEARLQTLKPFGVNAVRTAHNPPAPEFLDLCDRLGVLVMDEFFDCWTVGKNPHDYHLYFNEWAKIDARDTVRRDRNHPSVVLYSVGNEIRDTTRPDLAKGILQGLVDVCHQNDPTRPVTQGLFRPNVSHDYDNGLADLLDVIGTNYRDNELLAAQQARPERKIIGTEQRHDRQTWLHLRDHPSHSGQFLWTGVDYLGESRRWPVIAAGSGLLDRTGRPRPLAYERQSWWSDKPMVFIARRVAPTASTPADPGFDPLDRRPVLFADWTPPFTGVHEENVEVYSNCEQVELFLNGELLGTRPRPPDASSRNWKVPFKPGILLAVGRNGNHVDAECELHTAGKPAKILLSADRGNLAPTWDDVCSVHAAVVDEDEVPVPSANDLITFSLSGPGIIAAVDSADNSSHEPFQSNERRCFQGRCVALVKARSDRGEITIQATAPGLQPGSVTINAIAPRGAAKETP